VKRRLLIYKHKRPWRVPGGRIKHDATTEFALRLFRKCGKKYGFPKQALTDQGTQFYCADKEGKEHGESEFTQTLKELSSAHRCEQA
jgi:hypothetical protein